MGIGTHIQGNTKPGKSVTKAAKGNNNRDGKTWRMNSRRHLQRPSLLLGEIEPIVCNNKKGKELRAADPEKPRRESTGDMLFLRDRKLYEEIVHRLAENESSCEIHRQTKVDRTVIEAIRARERIPIERERDYILATVRKGARLYAERMVDLALTNEDMRPKEVAIATGILVDKMLLLSGEATSISQTTVTHQIAHADWNQLLDAVDITPVEGSEKVIGYPETPALPDGQGEAS